MFGVVSLLLVHLCWFTHSFMFIWLYLCIFSLTLSWTSLYKMAESDMAYERCIWIRGLPLDTSESDFHAFFGSLVSEQFTHCLFRDNHVYLIFRTVQDAESALQKLKDQTFKEHPMEVKYLPQELHMKVQGLVRQQELEEE